MKLKITEHQADLIRTLRAIKGSVDAGLGGQTHPPRYAGFLWCSLSGQPVSSSDQVSSGRSHAIRQIHDFYGWKAKGRVGRRGVCSGAFYRSAEYMATDLQARDGSKGPNRNIHIEHSVPTRVQLKALARRDFDAPADLHDFLIRNSVCSALSFEEQRLMDRAGVARSTHPAFNEAGELIVDRPFPFLRYRPLVRHGFRLFNVVTGKEIDIEVFSFDDHFKTLKAACRLINCNTSIYGLRS